MPVGQSPGRKLLIPSLGHLGMGFGEQPQPTNMVHAFIMVPGIEANSPEIDTTLGVGTFPAIPLPSPQGLKYQVIQVHGTL